MWNAGLDEAQDGETMKIKTDFIFLGSKITADGGCRHEIKRHLLLGRKAITNLDSILKSRDITLLTKVHLVKVMVFSVVMYECESWTIKKAEGQSIDAFEPWCWRRLLRVPWTARRSNQSILKEISPEYSLEGPMLKLKSFGHLMRRTDPLEKTLMLGKIEGRRRRGWQRIRSSTQCTRVWASSGSWWWTGKPGVLQSTGSQRVRHNWATEQQQWENKEVCFKRHKGIFMVTEILILCVRNPDCGGTHTRGSICQISFLCILNKGEFYCREIIPQWLWLFYFFNFIYLTAPSFSCSMGESFSSRMQTLSCST